jgi:hypothetical protein
LVGRQERSPREENLVDKSFPKIPNVEGVFGTLGSTPGSAVFLVFFNTFDFCIY